MSTGLRILLIRHGETHGYYYDVGLMPVGEAQAELKAKELAPQLPAGVHVAISHAPTARATATASVLRASLLTELADDSATTIGPLEVNPLFDSLQFVFDGAARESSAVATERGRLHERSGDLPTDRLPDWVAECTASPPTGGAARRRSLRPLDDGDHPALRATTDRGLPNVGRYRQVAGNAASAPISLVVSHSALLRALAAAAFAAAAFGADLGEPDNLEHVAVDVDPGGATARVGYRGHEITVEVPARVPPWLNPDYLDGGRQALPMP